MLFPCMSFKATNKWFFATVGNLCSFHLGVVLLLGDEKGLKPRHRHTNILISDISWMLLADHCELNATCPYVYESLVHCDNH